MDATSISKFPIDRFPAELRVMVYEMSDPFDTFCKDNWVPWFYNCSGCPYKKIPWARTILLASVLNDKDALELASIQAEYRRVFFMEPTSLDCFRYYRVRGDFPRRIFCELIALGGNLPALKWARTDRTCSMKPMNPSEKYVRRTPFPWTARVCSHAAKCGHFKIVKWAREQGCPWDAEATFAMVAELGDFPMLQWLHEQGCAWNDRSLYSAALGGHLEILKWFNEQPHPKYTNWSDASLGAAESGQLEVLMWLHGKKYKMNDRVFDTVVGSGHFHVLKWLHYIVIDDKRFRFLYHPSVCAVAARIGHLEMLQWLRERGYPWDRRTTYEAKKRGHSEIFEWATSHDCPYDENYSENSHIEEYDTEDDFDDEDNDEFDEYSEEDDMQQGDLDEDDDEEGENGLEDYSDDDKVEGAEKGDSEEDDDEVDEGVGEDKGVYNEEIIVTSKRQRRG